MTGKTFFYKARARIHRELVINSKGKVWYYWLYRSFWHYKLHKQKERPECIQYLSTRPNPGAGIGHQIANWLSGYKMAAYYCLQYSVFPFSDLNDPLCANYWDVFLGLNDGETTTWQLKKNGYKTVLLPQINFEKDNERALLGAIISSYSGEKVVFILEMDQSAGCELESLDFMRGKYWSSQSRKNDQLIFDKDRFNVAVHIRRGDIVQTGNKKNENLTMRWLDTDYYVEVLDKYLKKYSEGKDYEIYVFSQAEPEELEELEKFSHLTFCNHMNAVDSFLHMVNADMLIMSKSGMSYQAAKLNRSGIVIYPKGFWREPVESDNWIIE